ncbi:hypothetical protein HOY82DRAFT_670418 [Tuber indicum]|nr:hypothetical protein HOY82DRAFT_670418 [Tuber indicum]
MPKLASVNRMAPGAEVEGSVDMEEMVDMEDTGSEGSLSGDEGGEGYIKPPPKPEPKQKILPPVPLCPGQIYFSSRFHVKLKKSQQERLGANSVGTKNKCRKSRPWVIVEVLDRSRAMAMEKKTWSGVTKETAGSFLPISPTRSRFKRPVVHLAEDVRQIFTGRSLFFLEIQQEIKIEFLGDYIGSLTDEGLETLRDQRRRWVNNEKLYPPECHGKEEDDDDEYGEDDDGEEDEYEDEDEVEGDCREVDGEVGGVVEVEAIAVGLLVMGI